MRKRLLKALICTTAVLATLGLAVIEATYSGDTGTYDVSIDETKVEVADDATTARLEMNEPKLLPENPIEDVIESEINKEELSESKDIQESCETNITTESQNDALYSASRFKILGNIRWNGWSWTYYSEKVLPGGGGL